MRVILSICRHSYYSYCFVRQYLAPLDKDIGNSTSGFFAKTISIADILIYERVAWLIR